jgi:hypothetical protein
MDSMNLHASFQNLTQTDRVQQDLHRLPAVNQEQNAKIAGDAHEQFRSMPLQPDHAENRITDPRDRKRTLFHSKKRKKSKDKKAHGKSLESGLYIDCDA